MPHTFQLEEEQAILLLPSWPGLSEGAGAFSSVTLRYGAQELPPEYSNLLSRGRQLPTAYASAPLSPMTINGEIVWSAEVGIEPGKIYYYYYQVELNTPVLIGDGGTTMLEALRYSRSTQPPVRRSRRNRSLVHHGSAGRHSAVAQPDYGRHHRRSGRFSTHKLGGCSHR